MWLIDWLFPKNCVGCQLEGEWLCASCLVPLLTMAPQIGCADCGATTPNGQYCPDHAKDHKLTGLVVVQPFHKGTLREAIHNLKYNGVRELSVPLGTLMAKRLESYPHLREALLIPVPLHRSREQRRGFNQAKLLADGLASTLSQRDDTILQRRKTTATQASLSHERRRTNLRGIFFVSAKTSDKFEGTTVLLVDDVATTTTTLDEAATVLIDAGAKDVWGAVIAKG